ncbi:MAG: zeta toxin family protein [bacterium]
MRLAGALRHALIERRESFVFETVFSDPVGDKLGFLKRAAASGYTVILCFIGLARAGISEERVAMRVSQGGHDVPTEKLKSRFPRTLGNLRAALRELPHVLVHDNSDLRRPYRLIAVYQAGTCVERSADVPGWFRSLEP